MVLTGKRDAWPEDVKIGRVSFAAVSAVWRVDSDDPGGVCRWPPPEPSEDSNELPSSYFRFVDRGEPELDAGDCGGGNWWAEAAKMRRMVSR